MAKWKAHQDRLLAWPRLEDVARLLGIHRNQGESLCRAGGFAVEKDLTDDCRIPPEAVAYLNRRVEAEAAWRDWMPLIKLAEELAVPRNVLDGGLRKQRLEFTKDHFGQIILPPASVERLRAWRRKLDGFREVRGDNSHTLRARHCSSKARPRSTRSLAFSCGRSRRAQSVRPPHRKK